MQLYMHTIPKKTFPFPNSSEMFDLLRHEKSGTPDADIELDEDLSNHAGSNKRIICAACGAHITDSSFLTEVQGNTSHSFFNPHGYVFQIECYYKAPGCFSTGVPRAEFSWFAGFAWQISVCSTCSEHLGWLFTGDGPSFFGLIRNKISESSDRT